MSFELHIIQAREFVRLGAHGEFDWERSKAVLRRLAKECYVRGTDNALVDVRDVKADLSRDELIGLVHVFQQVGFSEKCRLALLHRKRPDSLAPLLAALANNRGFDVAAFDDFEHAVEWLSMRADDEFDTIDDAEIGIDGEGSGDRPPKA